MSLPFESQYARQIRRILIRTDRFLRWASGVNHVGPDSDQEGQCYHRKGLDVAWIAPVTEVFRLLKTDILLCNDHHPIQALVTDRDEETCKFHFSNNRESSSILPLKDHRDLWPEVVYTQSITMRTTTWPTLLKKENINSSKYQAFGMDTQGSELDMPEGTEPLLANFEFSTTETADLEPHEGYCQLSDLNEFMSKTATENSQKTFYQRFILAKNTTT
ncbi:MAG TPA: hypothetical protein DDZ51_02855 [Planctomycetaceae bacterium]|nr:hypothetical protein [Planctomycetaceae bacterium]